MPRRIYLPDSSSSEELCTPIRRPRRVRHPSVVSSRHHHHHVHEPAHAAPNLAVPVVEVGGRQRAASTGGLPQPNIIINNTDGSSRSRSRERVRPRSRSRGRRILVDEDFDEIVGSGRVSRSPSPCRHDFGTRQALERLRAFERAEAEEEARKRYKTELEAKLAKEELERIQEEEHRKALKKKAVEDWQREEDLKRIKEKKAKEERDKLIKEGKIELLKHQHPTWTLEEIMDELRNEGDSHTHEHRVHVNEMRIARSRPTHIRVNRKHLWPETLDAFELPWEYDSENTNFIIIREYIPSELQERLFEHTRELKRIRPRKLIEGPVEKTTTTVLKINDKKKDKMYLVRKKSSSGAGFTIVRT